MSILVGIIYKKVYYDVKVYFCIRLNIYKNLLIFI